MKTTTIFFMLFVILFRPVQSVADALVVETGDGFARSLNTEALLVRFQHEAPLFRQEGFYEAVYARWNGDNHAEDFALARGIRWWTAKDRSCSFAIGAGRISRTTGNLGTPLDFYFRLAYERKLGNYDLSFGVIHISNGKPVFRWRGPDNGENFLTLAIGRLF